LVLFDLSIVYINYKVNINYLVSTYNFMEILETLKLLKTASAAESLSD